MSNNDQLAARAVYAGLRRMTDDRSVIKSAFSYWQSELSNQEFDVVGIVTALIEYLGLTSQEKKSLMIALHAASNRLVDELDPVPGVISGNSDLGSDVDGQAQEQASSKPTEAVAPHLQVTQRYLQLFAQHMRKADNNEFTEFRQTVASEGLDELDKSLNTIASTWAANGMANIKLPSSASESDCKNVAHQMYMLACEFIGPNRTDNVALKAVDGCLDLDAASRFNPRDLVN